MHDAHDLLQTLAIVLCLAAVTTVVFHRLKQPVVFGYLLAGFIASPYTPIPLVADAATVRTLSELGVILLMFSLGLEFSLRKLIRVGPTAGVVAAAQSALMIWLGYTTGRLFGWTQFESIYAGAVIAISSTTIIAKAFSEQKVRGRFTELVLGILIIEDLIGILLITILTTISTGGALTATSLGVTALRLVSFLAVLIGLGLLLVPRIIRMVVRKSSEETTLVVSIGICFAAALAALAFQYSVALGAFIAGSLIAESGEERTVEHLVRPVRDIFAAIFFVAVGMMLDPRVIVRYWPAILVFTVIVITGKVLFVSVAAFFTGYSPRTAVQAGMSLAQIGEFSFIIAGVGLASGATREFLYPIAVSVSAITTLTTPWLIRFAVPAATWVDAKLPHPIQTFAALYGSWIERLRSTPAEPKKRSRARRLTGFLLLDAALLAIVIIAAEVEMPRFTTILRDWTGAGDEIARLIVIGGALAVGIPLVIGLLQGARRLGLELALRALPSAAEGKVDIAAAPRRALVVTLQMAIIMAVALPLLALTRPFAPGFSIEIALLLLMIGVGVGFWRSATNLEGHARAGAEVIAGALSRQMSTPGVDEQMERTIEQVHSFLPGLGEPTPVRVEEGSAAAGKTLAELNLRGLTGATVLAILRPDEQVLAPHGREMLRAGDLLAIAGTSEAIAAARAMIETGAGITQEHAVPRRTPERAEMSL